jgi:hypothetical protein
MSANSTLRGYELPPQTPPSRRRGRRGLELVFILGFLGCLLVGALALSALFWLSRGQEPPITSAPMALLAPEKVVVGLATRQLAGDATTALVSQALQANELDTAAALLLFDTDSTPSGRAALWQQLGRRWFEQGDAERSAVAYAQTVSIGALDVALSSLERSQLLTQAAAGLAAGGDQPGALAAATQAKRVIAQAPDLLPAQRSQLLQPLKIVVDALAADNGAEAEALAAEIDDLLRNPYVQPEGILLASSLATMIVPPAPDPAVEAAVATRQLAARNLADRYVLTSGIDTEPEVQALVAALLAEDQARGAAFRVALDAATSRQQQLGILLQQEKWMMLKLQVAHRAFGLTIAPEWEEALPALEGELNGLLANTAVVIDALAAAQPTPLEQNLLRAEGDWWLALQSELGHYPGANIGDTSERVQTAQSELERIGAPLALPVAWEPANPLPGFRIQER